MRRFAIFLILLFTTFVRGQSSYTYQQPQTLNDGWHTSSLKALEIDSTRIYQLFNQLAGEKHKLHSTLVVQNGKLILEEYFNDFDRDTQQDLRSATKSIRSLLIGIALDKGFIESLDDPIQKYLGDLKPKKNLDLRKDRITIRHLITMSPGWDCNDRDQKSQGQEDRIYRKKDWLQYALDLPLINDPGSVTNYCSIGTVMLMELLSKAAKMPVDAFAKKYLFDPLNITNYRWDHTAKKEVKPSAKRLYMTPRDMAKIGQLALQNGRWNDKQLVSEAWIQKSTSQHTQIDNSGYGFLWWMTQFPLNRRTIKGFAASGNGGQYIVVFPKIELICVFTGGAYNSPDAQLPIFIMRDIFIPAFGDFD